MKKITILVLSILVFLLLILPFGCERVDQGFRAAKVDLLASGKGSVMEIGPGRTFFLPWRTDVVPLPVHIQRYAFVRNPEEESKKDQSIKPTSKDNLEFIVGLSLHYKANELDGCITRIYREYKVQDFRSFSQRQMRDLVRESVHSVFSQYEATEIYGDKKPEVMENVTKDLRKQVQNRVSVDGNSCLIVDNLSIAELIPPQAVKKSVEKKVQAQQRALEEKAKLRQQKISSRKDSIRVAQEAENNRTLARSITPELVQWKRMQIMQDKWDGTLPMVQGSGGGLMFDMSQLQGNQ